MTMCIIRQRRHCEVDRHSQDSTTDMYTVRFSISVIIATHVQTIDYTRSVLACI